LGVWFAVIQNVSVEYTIYTVQHMVSGLYLYCSDGVISMSTNSSNWAATIFNGDGYVYMQVSGDTTCWLRADPDGYTGTVGTYNDDLDPVTALEYLWNLDLNWVGVLSTADDPPLYLYTNTSGDYVLTDTFPGILAECMFIRAPRDVNGYFCDSCAMVGYDGAWMQADTDYYVDEKTGVGHSGGLSVTPLPSQTWTWYTSEPQYCKDEL